MSFTVNLKAIRIKQNKSQSEFAFDLCMSQSQYSKLERGQSDFSLKQLCTICAKLGCTLSDIVEGDCLGISKGEPYSFNSVYFAYFERNNQALQLQLAQVNAQVDKLVDLLINANRDRIRLNRCIDILRFKQDEQLN